MHEITIKTTKIYPFLYNINFQSDSQQWSFLQRKVCTA